jgi:transposase
MGIGKFDRAFKEAVVKLYEARERTAQSLASEIGVHVNTIYKWAEEYASDPENAFPGKGHMKPDEEEARRLQRRIKELEEENAILKKAAAYFAKNSK